MMCAVQLKISLKFCSNLRLRGTPLGTKDTYEIIKIMIGLQL